MVRPLSADSFGMVIQIPVIGSGKDVASASRLQGPVIPVPIQEFLPPSS